MTFMIDKNSTYLLIEKICGNLGLNRNNFLKIQYIRLKSVQSILNRLSHSKFVYIDIN